MEKRELLYEGKARKLFTTDDENLLISDFKLEFGKDKEGNITLADEISPDNCRFWDTQTGEKMDKDRFRQGLGGLKVAYEQVLERILGSNK